MEIEIDKEYDGARVDRYVKKILADKPMSLIFKMFKKGDIRVNGKKVKENDRLSLGDILYIYGDAPKKNIEFIELSQDEMELIKNNIVLENENFIIFNKPSKIVMHKGSGFEYGLVEILKSYYKNNDINFVNRLDKETSGLVIASKNLEYTRKLTEIIRDRNINKHYYALVKGIPKEKEFKVELNLLDDGTKTIVVEENKGKESLTHFKHIKSSKNMSLIECKIESGRKHQIRVHLSHIGLPIIGDNKYGVRDSKEMFLNSYKLEIEELNLKIDRGIPKEFINRMNKE